MPINKNVELNYRLQVTVYDVLSLQQPQAAEQRAGEPPDEAQAEPLVVVLLYQLVQVYTGNHKEETFCYINSVGSTQTHCKCTCIWYRLIKNTRVARAVVRA